MLEIDGALGEGGGQILRTSLALSMCLSKPFKIVNIRATRKNPGLRPQHLAAVNAAAEISHASKEGAVLGSQQLIFHPHGIFPGHYDLSIGTAGSTTLVLQTVLPALMLADSPSSLNLEGGTHNPLAPPFDFLEQAFLPLINRMGPTITTTLERPGFFPKGGGRFRVNIQPTAKLKPLNLLERGEIVQQRAQILLAHLPQHIAQRERAVIAENLNLADDCLTIRSNDSAFGPGNVVTVIVQSENVTEVFTGFGERGVPAEVVAGKVVKAVKHYLRTGIAVGPYLADQLLLPIALAGESSFLTSEPSQHTLTNMSVIKEFMQTDFTLQEISPDVWQIELTHAAHYTPGKN